MAEYIEKKRAFQVLRRYYHHRSVIQEMALSEALDMVPVAKVKPVVRGEWIGDMCGACGISKYNFFRFDSHASPFGTWNFCPRCGADMREKQP